MTNSDRITRAQYLKHSSALHHDYYAQFVTEATLHFIQTRIGVEKLKRSEDPRFFNDLYKHGNGGRGGWIWDVAPMDLELARELGEVGPRGMGSPATHTCVGKAAARMLLEGAA